MAFLSRVESVFEAIVEGSFRRIFSPPLQPIELARALERVMIGEKVVGPASVDVPNVYVARLHPSDYERFAALQGTVEREAAGYLDRRADEEGFRPIGPIQVTLMPDDAVARSFVRGEAKFDETAVEAGLEPVEQTRRFEPIASGPIGGQLAVLAEDGKELQVADRPVRVGRGIDNDLVIRDLRVSRYHISIEPAPPQGWLVRDLQSTNGTYLDGQRVEEMLVDTPIELSLGGYRLTLRPG